MGSKPDIISKLLKSYADGGVIGQLSEQERDTLYEMATKIKNVYKSSEVPAEHSKKMKPKAAQSFLVDVKNQLESYQNNGQFVNLDIDLPKLFNLINNQEQPTAEVLNQDFKWLNTTEATAKSTILLVQFAKGWRFWQFKQLHQGNFKKIVQDDLGLSYTQVDRYCSYSYNSVIMILRIV